MAGVSRQGPLFVSVIMPAHNAEQTIRSSILSVLKQTHSNLELLIIDDGSSDTTREVVEQTIAKDHRVTLHSMKKCSGGPATPRNLGLRHAKGTHVAFIDADDQWASSKIERQLKVMMEHELDFVSTMHQLSHKKSQASNPASITHFDVRLLKHSQMLRKNRVITSSALMTSDVLEGHWFDESPEVIAIEDYVLWLKLLEDSTVKAGVLQEQLVWYRVRADSLSSSKLQMAAKIYNFLGLYKRAGQGLGLKKYVYFGSYLGHSIVARVFRSLR